MEIQLKLLRNELAKQVLIGDVHLQSYGCICRACYRGLEWYKKLQATLLKNMMKAIAVMPTCGSNATTV